MVCVFGSRCWKHETVGTVLCQRTAGLFSPPALLPQIPSTNLLFVVNLYDGAGRVAAGEREWVGVKSHVKGQYKSGISRRSKRQHTS
jgi:hypothetical protein